ncbi:MAG: nucleotidyltransferase domain-containing protein [Candidatus Diapherotrites archaeon]
MDLLSQFLTPINLRLFELLIDNPYFVRELALKAKVSPAKVTQFSKLFARDNLIQHTRELNRKKIAVNKDHPLVREIISLIFIHKIIHSKSFQHLQSISQSIGVYGSVVEGTVDQKSDIDLWVLSPKKVGMIESGTLQKKMTQELEREVSLKFYKREELDKLKTKDPIFYNELVYKSKIVYGDGF